MINIFLNRHFIIEIISNMYEFIKTQLIETKTNKDQHHYLTSAKIDCCQTDRITHNLNKNKEKRIERKNAENSNNQLKQQFQSNNILRHQQLMFPNLAKLENTKQ